MDFAIMETPVFYDDDVNVAFNVEVVKGNSKHLNVDKNVKRLYISVADPENKEETNLYLQKYLSKVLDVAEDFINVTEVAGNKKLIYVPQSEIKATEAIDKVVALLSKSVLRNENHGLTRNLKKLYSELEKIPDNPVPRKNDLKLQNQSSVLLIEHQKQIQKRPVIHVFKKVGNISENIKIVHDAKGNIVFMVEKIKGYCNRILDIQASVLKVEILAPDYESAQEAELMRYLSGVFMISREDVVLKQITGSEMLKVLLTKLSIDPKTAVKKLVEEYNNGGEDC